MPSHSCVYCGRCIQRNIKGHPASDQELKASAALYHPLPARGDYICDTHRRHPPVTPLLRPVSKRQRAAEILSSSSRPQQRPSVEIEPTSSVDQSTPLVTTSILSTETPSVITSAATTSTSTP